MARRRSRPCWQTVMAASALLAATLAGGSGLPAASASGPCGTLSYQAASPPHYSHVVIVMDENLSYRDFQQTGQAPYLHGLAASCGSETSMHAATHPSQPNYMAATSGAATKLGQHSANDNIFHQAQAASDIWKSYEESMAAPCGAASGFYKRGHNPAYWYTDLRRPVDTCRSNDVPSASALDQALTNDSLPTFSWISPNLCHDMHWLQGCPTGLSQRVASGDQWISDLLGRLVSLPSYLAGRTLILVTWDEGNGPSQTGVDCTSQAVYSQQASCRIPTIVVSPYITPGRTDADEHDLYGLLGTVEDVLGYPRLGQAQGRPSLRPGLGF